MERLKQIIIIEDSEIIARIIGMTIKKMEGFDSLTFLDGESFLMEINLLHPAAIFIDYHLDTEEKDGMNGGEIAKTIHNLMPELPIIMMTGSTEPQILDIIKSLPIAAFIHKDAEDVLEQVEDAVLRFCQ